MTNTLRDELVKVITMLQYSKQESEVIADRIIDHLTPTLEEVERVLQQCDEAMGYMSEYDIPLCLPDDTKQSLTKLSALLGKGE